MLSSSRQPRAAKKRANRKTCLGAGFVALDVIRQRGSEGLELRAAGGSCGNVLSILSYLDWNAAPLARIGVDAAGAELLEDLRKFSVDTAFLSQEECGRTPVVFQEIYSTRAGKVRHRFSKECTLCGSHATGYRPLLESQVDDLLHSLPAPTAFFFDRVAKANLTLAKRAADSGALVVFEPSGIKDEELFLQCVSVSHVFKYSQDRLPQAKSLVDSIRVPVVVQTRGEDGLDVWIRSRGKAKAFHLPAFESPRTLDASGSGDWCTAGLIHRLAGDHRPGAEFHLDRVEIIDALRFGQCLAALNCAFQGARGLMYSIDRERVLRLAQKALRGDELRIAIDLSEVDISPGTLSHDTCVVCARALARPD